MSAVKANNRQSAIGPLSYLTTNNFYGDKWLYCKRCIVKVYKVIILSDNYS